MVNNISFEAVAKAVNEWAKVELKRRALATNRNFSAFMQLQNYLSKVIVTKPRKVSCSESLIVPKNFYNEFEELKSHFIKGEDVNGYLSRRLKKAFFTDGLLDNYGIHHFHFEKTGTLEIILAIVTVDEVFFIETKGHGQKYPYTWVDKSVLEVIHKERPDLMPCIKYSSINTELGIREKEDIKILRENGYNFMITLDDGTIYMPAGHGAVSIKNKHYRLSTKHFDRFIYHVLDIQQTINLYLVQKIEIHKVKIEKIEIFDLESTDFKSFNKFSIKTTYSKDNFRGEITEIFQTVPS